VGAPADTAVAAIVGNPASATRSGLDATYARVVRGALVSQALTDGTDQTATVTAELAALYAAGGGTYYLPIGTVRADSQIVLPHDSGSTWKNAPIRVIGCGARQNGLGLSGGMDAALGGTVLDLRYSGADAKILTFGRGLLHFENLTITDLGTSSTPFLLSINTTITTKNVTVAGNPSKSGAACDQDAIILGGTSATSGNLVTSWFSGYGTHIQDISFSRIRRGVYARAGCNAITVTNPTFDIYCGGTAGYAAIEIDGLALDGVANVFINPVIEMTNYVYGVRIGPNGHNVFINPGFYDMGSSFLACFYLFGGSSANLSIGGWNGNVDPSVKWVAGDGNSGNSISVQASNCFYTPITFAGNPASGGISGVVVCPAAATGVETSKLLRVVRSTLEATNPNVEIASVWQNGQINTQGASASLNVTNGTSVANYTDSSIIKPSGDLLLYAGTGSTDSIRLMRGTFQIKTFTTAGRPAANAKGAGTMYYDTTVSKPVWSDGTTWRDAMGTAV